MPEDYGDTFKVMGEVGAIDRGFSEELIKMAKLRNRLVHIYWEIDDKLLYSIIEDHLGDLNRFIKSIAKFLQWDTDQAD